MLGEVQQSGPPTNEDLGGEESFAARGAWLGCVVSMASAAALGILALAKVALLAVDFTKLSEMNAFLQVLPNWAVLAVSVLVELAVAGVLAKHRWMPRRAGLWLIWLCALIAVYRLGMWLFSPLASCHCLGIAGMLVGSVGRNESAIAVAVWLGLTSAAIFLLSLGTCREKHVHQEHLATVRTTTVILACLGVLTSPSQAGVQISGYISSEYYSSVGKLVNRGGSQFRIVKDGQRWQLISERPGLASVTITSDGATTFTVISGTNVTPRMRARGVTHVDDRTQNGLLDPWAFPLLTAGEHLPWWFLILSSDADVRVSELPAPWITGRSDPQAFFCSNSVQWSGVHPRLVAAVTFAYSRDRVRTALDSPWLDRASPLRVSRADLKVLDGLLKNQTNLMKASEAFVSEWTNSPYGRYPSRFQCHVYDSPVSVPLSLPVQGIDPGSADRGPAIRIKHSGAVTNFVETSGSVVCPPALVKPTFVADNRFRDPAKDIQRMEYGPVDGWNPDVKEVRTRVASGQLSTRTIGMVSEPSEWLRWPLAALLLLLGGLPLLALRLKKRRSR